MSCGTSRDEDKALYWLGKSAAQGNENARNEIEAIMSEKNNRGIYQVTQKNTPTQKSEGCYVATAVYGSYDCPEGWTLRRYRDFSLSETWYGRIFIKVYYAISPTLVKWFGQTKWFRRFWKAKLDYMVNYLRKKGLSSSPYSDKNY